jgi:uncharacterized membrane protein SpoIIM required for sporulation
MKRLAETLAARRQDWQRLEQVTQLVSSRALSGARGELVMELSDLYRRACADLAMAEQYHLSPAMVEYLHGLVGRAHAALYRSRRFHILEWWTIAFHDVPRQIYRDRCVQISSLLFFGLFSLSAFLAFNQERFPNFAERMIGMGQIEQMESSFGEMSERSLDANMMMVGFYIQHNTGIGLQCFALGVLLLPGLFASIWNAVFLGACFGYMARPDTVGGDGFLEFVTAHGAFELSAIALSAGAGLRIGTGWLFTGGMTRRDSLRASARRALPIMGVAAALFFLAALTEGLISPTGIPYAFKAAWLVFSSGALMFYFIVLGYPEPDRAVGPD